MTERWQVHCGKSEQVLTLFPDACFDSMVTDPPAGIGFMGKGWDKDKGGRDKWIAWLAGILREAYRVLKPGAHCFVWALPRTQHWTQTACEDAGFEVRDVVAHMFSTGFPKSLSVSKAIDSAAGADREVVGHGENYGMSKAIEGKRTSGDYAGEWDVTAPATDAAKQWDGWGTSLKPAVENWLLLTKPIASEKLLAAISAATNALEVFLWSMSPVKFARMCSGLNQNGSSGAESGSVRWLAAVCLMAESPERSDRTDMFQSREAGETILNIAQSWSAIWAEVYQHGNTYTIETETALITALQILRSSILQTTPENTAVARTLQSGEWVSVLNAENSSSAEPKSLTATLNATAPEHAGQQTSNAIRCIIASIVETISTYHQSTSGSFAGPDAMGLADEPHRHESWILARKPLIGTVAGNVLEFGTGGINVDGCRIASGQDYADKCASVGGKNRDNSIYGRMTAERTDSYSPAGRWPPNTLLSHSHDCEPEQCRESCPVRELDRQSGDRPGMSGGGKHAPDYPGGMFGGIDSTHTARNDSGGAARFFPTFNPDPPEFPFLYSAKPSSAERDAGLDGFESLGAQETVNRDPESAGAQNPRAGAGRGAGAPRFRCRVCGVHLGGGRAATKCTGQKDHTPYEYARGKTRKNGHPTVKSSELMRWLCRLVTPPGGIILDPFAGSGSTGIGAILEGFDFHGIELDPYHTDIARARIAHVAGTDWEPLTKKATAAKPTQGNLF